MKSIKLRRLLALSVIGAAWTGAGAGAGELNVENGQPVWSSVSCIQPVPSQVDKADAQTLNESINRYNRFVAAVDQYNRCLRDEADSDLVGLRQAVNDSVRALQDQAIAEAAAVRAAINAPRGPDEPAAEASQ